MIARESSRIIRDTVNGAGFPAPFADLVLVPLMQPGKILNDPETTGWSKLVGASARAVGASDFAAARVAAAIEVLAAALDVLDEIEDGDSSVLVDLTELPQAINLSTTLLFLSQHILAELPGDGTVAGDIPAFATTVSRLGMAATVGQHRDLSISIGTTPSLAEAFEISQEKSGSLTACACRLGALLGTRDAELLDMYESFGRSYGTMSQLSNDLHDAQNQGTKSDLSLKKPTLPITFFRRGLDDDREGELRADEIVDSGALHFTWVVFERERERCLGIVEKLASRGQDTVLLKSLID